jgi:HSP20 family protein
MMKALSTWQIPFRNLNTSRDIDEFFSSLLSDWQQAGMPDRSVPTGYIPQSETSLDETAFRIKADLPGIDPHDVELTVKDNQLTLKGERKAAQEQPNGNRLQREVRYGAFARTFTLPEGVKAEEVQARYHNGVLEITVPLPAAKLPRKVPVQIAGEEHQASASSN